MGVNVIASVRRMRSNLVKQRVSLRVFVECEAISKNRENIKPSTEKDCFELRSRNDTLAMTQKTV